MSTWHSYRKFVIQSIVRESDTAKSFYIVPADGGPIAAYHPGQHLTLRLQVPGQLRPVTRCYTISDCYRGTYYRLTIKRESAPQHIPNAPDGLSSSYFHDNLRIGDVVEAKMPSGSFYLDMEQQHPVVMIAGGIGMTPMMSMLNAIELARKPRRVYVLFALQHGGHHVFKECLRELRSAHPHIQIRVLYENPRGHEHPNIDFDLVGRIDRGVLQQFLPPFYAEYFLCGPPGMMQAVLEVLHATGVPEARIRTESFGPSSPSYRNALLVDKEHSEGLEVKFLRSGITTCWVSADGTLLDLAERHGIDIDAGCRYGDCATCLTPLVSGRVTYLHPTGVEPEPGTCLPCSCKPETAIELDA